VIGALGTGLVRELLRNIRADIARVDDEVDTLRADIAADLIAVNAGIGDERADRRAAPGGGRVSLRPCSVMAC
jgi:hypothetical protein